MKHKTWTEDSLRDFLNNGNSLAIAPIVAAINGQAIMLDALKSIAVQAESNCINVVALAQQARSAITEAGGDHE